jgi:hypothetical protein
MEEQLYGDEAISCLLTVIKLWDTLRASIA